MDAQELRALQEAYSQVYELGEGYGLDPKFGSMRKRGGRSAPPEERSVGGERNRSNKDYWADVQGKNRDRGKGNRAAKRVSALKEDLYDIILSHLLDEGYADTQEQAEAIMVNMSEDWKESIVEEVLEEGEKPFPHEKVKEKQVALRDKGSAGLDRRMKMGMAVRRAKEADKKGGSQQDAGKDWYHGK